MDEEFVSRGSNVELSPLLSRPRARPGQPDSSGSPDLQSGATSIQASVATTLEFWTINLDFGGVRRYLEAN